VTGHASEPTCSSRTWPKPYSKLARDAALVTKIVAPDWSPLGDYPFLIQWMGRCRAQL
jgi:hypothetical protein